MPWNRFFILWQREFGRAHFPVIGMMELVHWTYPSISVFRCGQNHQSGDLLIFAGLAIFFLYCFIDAVQGSRKTTKLTSTQRSRC